MARDLVINGTNFLDRLGANKYGTFWSAVQPPYPKSAQELVTNVGFEVDTSGWVGIGGYAIARTTAQFHSGVASLEMSNAFGSSSAYARYTATLISGGKYRLSFWCRSTSGNTTLNVTPDNASPQAFTMAVGAWRYFTFVFTSTLTTGGVGFGTSGGASVFQIDDISLTYMDDVGSYTLDQGWAERLAENTGRVRGLSGIGTIPIKGTFSYTFPVGYFSFTPIVKVRHVRDSILKSSYLRQHVEGGGGEFVTVGDFEVYQQGAFMCDNPFDIEYQIESPYNVRTIREPYYSATGLHGIGTLGFKVTNLSINASSINLRDKLMPIYWHAYGV